MSGILFGSHCCSVYISNAVHCILSHRCMPVVCPTHPLQTAFCFLCQFAGGFILAFCLMKANSCNMQELLPLNKITVRVPFVHVPNVSYIDMLAYKSRGKHWPLEQPQQWMSNGIVFRLHQIELNLQSFYIRIHHIKTHHTLFNV